jgi:hypothetical protein
MQERDRHEAATGWPTAWGEGFDGVRPEIRTAVAVWRKPETTGRT